MTRMTLISTGLTGTEALDVVGERVTRVSRRRARKEDAQRKLLDDGYTVEEVELATKAPVRFAVKHLRDR